jgi:hypothetical protein
MIQKIFLATMLSLVPYTTVLANGTFVPLSQNIPGGPNKAFGGGLFQLLNYIFAISIGVAAILAVIMLTIGGFRYMTSESVFSLGSAKENITNAIVGILIVLTAVLVLKTINPDIVLFNLFKNP